MSDTDDSDLDRDWERQRRFLKEGFGLSDDEIEQLKKEYDGMGIVLDAMMEYGENAEDFLEEDEFEEVAENSERYEQKRLTPIEQDGPLDIYEINGRKLVPYDQVHKIIDEINQRLEQRDSELDEMFDRMEGINSTASKNRISEEAKQAIDNIYNRAYGVQEGEEKRLRPEKSSSDNSGRTRSEETGQAVEDMETRSENRSQLPATTTEDFDWTGCTVDKAYKSQEKLLEDGNLCALGPAFADELGLEEGEELKVRRADQPKKSAVYTVDEIWEQDAQLRISNKGRKRLDGKSSFEGEVLPLNR